MASLVWQATIRLSYNGAVDAVFSLAAVPDCTARLVIVFVD